MNKKIFLLYILLLFALGCKNEINTTYSQFKIDFLKSTKENYIEVIEKYNITEPINFNIKDQNYFYPFARLFYKKIGSNKWSDFLLLNASKKNNLFISESISLYIKCQIEKKNWKSLKKFLIKKENFLPEDEKYFLTAFANNLSLNFINDIPNKKEYLPLLYQIIFNNPSELKNINNKIKLHNFITGAQIYQNFNHDNGDAEYLKKITTIDDSDLFLNNVYYYLKKDKKAFIYSLEKILEQKLSDEKLEYLKKISISLGCRKFFYQFLENAHTTDNIKKYYYAIEAIKYGEYKKGIELLEEALEFFNQKSQINSTIRYNLLQIKKNLNDDWINNIIAFCNDYPNEYRSKKLLNMLFDMAILQHKEKFIAPVLKKISFNQMTPLSKSIYLYKSYLVDKENQTGWKNIITDELPQSYAGLRVNDGKVILSEKNQILKKRKSDFFLSGDKAIAKIKYMLEFDLIDDVLKIEYDNFKTRDLLKIYDMVHKHLIDNERYYDAIHFSINMAGALYQNNYYNIDNSKFIKRLYPIHYKKIVYKYSELFDIEPALIFAIIREESCFNKKIVSSQNAIGLMQILPSTGKFIAGKLKIKNYNLYNPDDNIKMGIYYVNFLKRYFTKNEYLLSCYNAGQGRTKRWYEDYKKYPDEVTFELIPFYETRHYIRKVMKSYYIYKHLLKDDKNT